MSVASNSTQDIDTVESSLYLVTKNTAPQQTPLAPQSLLERFNLVQIQNEFSHSAVPNTFKSYIDHLPGDFHISKRGRVPVGGSIKKIVAEGPPIEDDEFIHFELFDDQTLRDAFTLQDGGYKKKKKKKKKKVEGQNGVDGKKHKKRKRNKDSQENAPVNGNGELTNKKKKKKKDNPQTLNGEHVIVHV